MIQSDSVGHTFFGLVSARPPQHLACQPIADTAIVQEQPPSGASRRRSGGEDVGDCSAWTWTFRRQSGLCPEGQPSPTAIHGHCEALFTIWSDLVPTFVRHPKKHAPVSTYETAAKCQALAM